MADTNHQDHANAGNDANAQAAKQRYDYGGNPLAREQTGGEYLPAFGGSFQPGTFKYVKDQKIANPAPLGLCGFALTTFLLSVINIGVRGTSTPNIIIGAAFGYGGLVQLLAGMWEMAVGNTFGATALSSYGGFWISFAIIFTPGGFAIDPAAASTSVYAKSNTTIAEFYNEFAFYLFGWFIFTFLMLICTLRSTVAFFFLFLTLDLAFLCLAIGYLDRTGPMSMPNTKLVKAGGYFGIFSAFAAWYNALAGILDQGNSFFLIPVAHFPWSEKGRKNRGKEIEEEIHKQS